MFAIRERIYAHPVYYNKDNIKYILKRNLQKVRLVAWTGLIRLMIGTGGGLFKTG